MQKRKHHFDPEVPKMEKGGVVRWRDNGTKARKPTCIYEVKALR
jgi:hypothetical protein